MANVSLTQVQLDSIITAINARAKTADTYTKTEADSSFITASDVNALFTPAVLTALVP